MAADYYAILKNAIGALPDSTGEARRAVYEKARRAVVDQLKAFDPPLSATEITQERLRLEDCIRRVEAEAARGILTQTLNRTTIAPPPPPPSYREPETRQRPAYEPPTRTAPPLLDRDRAPRPFAPPPPAEPATGYGYDRQEADRPITRSMPPAAYTPPQLPPAPAQNYEPVTGLGSQALRQAVQEADQLGAAVAETAQNARDTLLSSGQTTDPFADGRAPTGGQNRPLESPPEAIYGAQKKSKAPMIAAIVVAVAVIGVGVAALWTQQDRIATILGVQKPFGLGQSKPSGGNLPPKSQDSLLAADDAGGTIKSNIKPVQSQPITVPPSDQAPAADPAPAAPKPADAGAQPILPPVGAPQVAQQTQVAPPPQQPVPMVAQKVTMMEENPVPGSQPILSTGKVVWQLVKESPQTGKPPVNVLRGRVEIPDRKINMTLSMQPNTDPGFSASHLIEIRFNLPPDFDGKGIASVPGIILKPNEQAQGQPLAGATARISAGFFWIALSANDADKQRNMASLRDGGWLAVPVVYETGKRGVITIEKAGAGDKVFADAFAAWQAAGP